MVRQTRIVAIVRGLDGHFTELAQACMTAASAQWKSPFRLGNPDEFYKTIDSIREIRAAMVAVWPSAPERSRVEARAALRTTQAQSIVSRTRMSKSSAQRRRLNAFSMPGAMTPSEVRAAYDAGADFVKAFPRRCSRCGLYQGPPRPARSYPRCWLSAASVKKNVAEFISWLCRLPASAESWSTRNGLKKAQDKITGAVTRAV